MHFLLETSYASLKRFELQRRPSDPTVSQIFIASSISRRDIPAGGPTVSHIFTASSITETSQRSHRQPDLHRELHHMPDLHRELHHRDIPAVPPSARSSPRAPSQRHPSGPTVSQIFTASFIAVRSQWSYRQLTNRNEQMAQQQKQKQQRKTSEKRSEQRAEKRQKASEKKASTEQKKIIILFNAENIDSVKD